mgnify:CR=1 FL=1
MLIEFQRFKRNENVTHFNILIDDIYFGIGFENSKFSINTGTYQASKYYSPKNDMTVILLKVPNKKFIEVHPANYYYELKGCFAPVGIASMLGGWNSQKAFKSLLNQIKWHQELNIKISENYIIQSNTIIGLS